MPRVSDQSVYYARQIYKYNLTFVVGDSRAPQNKNNVFIYEWDESQQSKSSNEIASAVYHLLLTLDIQEKIKVIRLASDGCGGQNKNTTVMGALCVWFLNYAPQTLETLEFIFPIVGHSYLPSDRVFGRIEKEIKKTSDPIVDPDQYNNIFSNHGTVVQLGDKVYDWKKEVKNILKPPGKWHFRFNPTKRFFFKRNKELNNILLRGEVHYATSMGVYRSVCKKGCVIKDFNNLEIIPIGKNIAPLKIRDVVQLLTKHYGPEWKDLELLKYFKNIVDNQTEDEPVLLEENCGNQEDGCQNISGHQDCKAISKIRV